MTLSALPERLLDEYYNIEATSIERLGSGVGGETFAVSAPSGRYVLKLMRSGGADHPENEPYLCAHLRQQGVPVSEYVADVHGALVQQADGRMFHLQRFVDGDTYRPGRAPERLMPAMAATLGDIHRALAHLPPLPEGIGAAFIRSATPEKAADSFRRSLAKARKLGDSRSVDELKWRVSLAKSMGAPDFDITALTRVNTHGDYHIGQLICGEGILAVTDWTCACVHPAVWELARSYAYSASADGTLSVDAFAAYVGEYLERFPLTRLDLMSLPSLYSYQLAVCDHYGQYYASTHANRDVFLHQARFSTGALRWLCANSSLLKEALLDVYCGGYTQTYHRSAWRRSK